RSWSTRAASSSRRRGSGATRSRSSSTRDTSEPEDRRGRDRSDMGHLEKLGESITKSQIWKSIFRHGMPDNPRNRMLTVLTNVFLHLHPVKVRKSGVKL